MMKKSIFFLILAITIITILLFLKMEWDIEKDVLYLKNRDTIISDKTSEGEKLIYYETDGAARFLVKDEVGYIGYGEIQETTDGWKYLSNRFERLKKKIQQLLEPWETESTGWFSVVRKIVSFWMLPILILPAGFLVARRFLRKKEPVKTAFPAKVKGGMPPQKKIEEDSRDISDTLKIVKFFLELFRLQTGAPEDAPAETTPLDVRTIGKNQVYQLRIFHAGKWVSRRMSIGPLGDESSSKSKCFYVIYDVHMVLKIPPKKLTDFNAYKQSIQSERHIAERLSPKECITPRISVILKRVYTFPGEARMTPEKLEEKYIQLLGTRSTLQEYLKIDGRFVFFMDFSRYYFLGHIIETIHDLDQKIFQEITQNSGIIWDAQGFAGRYGRSNGAICFKIQKIYAEFEREIRNYFASKESIGNLHQYQIKNWFLIHLTGNRVKADPKIPDDDEKILKINNTAAALFKTKPDEIAAYRKSVYNYIRGISYGQNKAQMESISANTLSLLALLGEKQIAMRDLKPDNLLVAGDPSDYPNFLKSVSTFSIGLIDVETAVDYLAAKGEAIRQPQLGGTPNYATPTHLFDNTLLNSVYDDLSLILHLQDWHATTAIIYKVAIGKNLFSNTGKSLPGIIQIVHQAVAEKKLGKEIVQETSRIFWKSAAVEFNLKIKKYESFLKSLILALPESVKKHLKKEALRTREEIVKFIETASCEKITAVNIQWKKENAASVSDTAEKINVLRILERLKLQSDRLSQTLEELNAPYAKLTVYEVLILMFAVVHNSMFRPEWTTGSEKESPEESRVMKP